MKRLFDGNDLHDWPAKHAFLFRIIVALKRMRTKAALAVGGWCIIEGLLFGEAPFDVLRPNFYVVMGLLLVTAGITLRLAAYGNLRKKEALSTTGVYSICRHPLYLGSILLTFGFCVLLNDFENYLFAAVYFALFYPLTIAWEEVRLAERYKHDYVSYARRTPLIIPSGRFLSGNFGWRAGLRSGGLTLLLVIFVSLIGIEVMARMIPQGY